jgi:hypothetical protein
MLSPFFRDDVLTSRLSTSAPRRLPARSKDARVRVLGSKNRLATVQREQVSQVAVVVQLQAGFVLENLVGLGTVHRAGILH